MSFLKAALAMVFGEAKPSEPEDDLAERFGFKAAPKAGKKKSAAKKLTPKPERPKRPPAWRLAAVGAVFVGVMGLSAYRLAERASEPGEAPPAPSIVASGPAELPRRADVVDRHGAPLIGSVRTYELYLDLSALDAVEAEEAAETIAAAFPDLSAAALKKRFKGRGTPLLKMPLTPVEAQRAHNLGVPGLYVKARMDRVYFAGRATSHLLGWTRRDAAKLDSGEAGLEGGLDAILADGERPPVALSIDLRLQIAVREILAAGVARTGAKGGAAVAISPVTGEVLALVSLPDFDPHDRGAIARARGRGAQSPVFNRAAAGRYELGSVMKIATWALALESGAAAMIDVYPPPTPFEVNGRTISDDYKMGRLSFPMAFAKSSNVISAGLALKAGRPKQHRLYELLGLHAPVPIELREARGAPPKWTRPWNDLATATVSYGHGLSLSPLQLAEVVATIVGGGERVRATLLRDPSLRAPRKLSEPAISPLTSRRMRDLLRLAVTDGTGKRADVPGLEVGGKTGTADKPKRGGGYFTDRVISSFVAAFPMTQPEAVIVVTLDEPSVTVEGRERRGAALTAAPVAREIIRRAAPLLGVAPSPS